jgi:hypothetical protein
MPDPGPDCGASSGSDRSTHECSDDPPDRAAGGGPNQASFQILSLTVKRHSYNSLDQIIESGRKWRLNCVLLDIAMIVPTNQVLRKIRTGQIWCKK